MGPRAVLALLLLPVLAGCVTGPTVPAHTSAQEPVDLAREELSGWDLVYLAAGGSLGWEPGKSETWSVGMAHDGQVAVVIVRGDGVRVSPHPGEDRVVDGGEVLVNGPWSDGGAPPALLGDGWRGLDVLPEPEGLHWMAFLHGEEPRWDRLLIQANESRIGGDHVWESFDARSGQVAPPLEALSARDAVDRWRAAGGEGEVTGLFSIDNSQGFASHQHPWLTGHPTRVMPLLLVFEPVGDGRATQWLLASGNATWRVDATGAVRLDDGLLEARVPLGDWVDSPDAASHFYHSGSMFLHADEPGRPVWTVWSTGGDLINGGNVDARPVPVLHLRGRVVESGPSYTYQDACGVALPNVASDGERRRIEYASWMPIHPAHDLFLLDDAHMDALYDDGCSRHMWLHSGNGTAATWWNGLAATVEDGGVRIGNTLLQRPGDTANVTVHWSVTEARNGEGGTWTYDGTLTATWLGTWPRGNITPTLDDPS